MWTRHRNLILDIECYMRAASRTTGCRRLPWGAHGRRNRGGAGHRRGAPELGGLLPAHGRAGRQDVEAAQRAEVRIARVASGEKQRFYRKHAFIVRERRHSGQERYKSVLDLLSKKADHSVLRLLQISQQHIESPQSCLFWVARAGGGEYGRQAGRNSKLQIRSRLYQRR